MKLVFECSECQCSYSTEKNLKSHVKKKHMRDNLNVKPQISINGDCAICNCPIQDDTLLHFSSVHDIKVDMQILEFPSVHDFNVWKVNMEKDTVSKFVKRSGSWNADTYLMHYYICHRLGKFISESKGQRCLKTQGTNKIGAVCPANMKVKEDKASGKCNVTFVKTHLGHENTIGHIFLSPEERKQLAVTIASKVSFDAILDEVRYSVSNDKLSRLHLLKKKDLHNIETSYNLSSVAVRDQNDAISVEAWVEKMKNKDCVLFYNLDLKKKTALKADLITLTDSLSTMEEEQILKKIVSSTKSVLMPSRSQHVSNLPNSKITGPSNKKVMPQRRLYSVKKKRTSSTKQLKKPTVEETTCIAASLIIGNNTTEVAIVTLPSIH